MWGSCARARLGMISARPLRPLFVEGQHRLSSMAMPVEETFTGLFPSNYKSINRVIPGTTSLEIRSPSELVPLPCYQLIDNDGKVLDGAVLPQMDSDTLIMLYQKMNILRVMDSILYDAQRQGRISFYMTCTGEEGSILGSAAGLSNEDPVLAQYREQGVLMWRGFTLKQFTSQCFSNNLDLGKGRQMPVHYGSVEHNFHFVSSPLATQIPQAVGAAYAIKRENREFVISGQRRCAAVFFGEGAASEGDFHAAMNFSSTLDVPLLFLCRNNGYAISTPAAEQFRSDGIADRAAAYGMHSIRVDGNDTLAVMDAVKMSRKFAVENNRPVFVELMSYRVGHHSTSDDSTRYRPFEEIENVRKTNCPVKRLGGYLRDHGLWSESMEEELQENARKEVMNAMRYAEAENKPPLRTLFSDVYDELPPHLVRQKAQLTEHMKKYGKHYDNLLKMKRIKMDTTMD